MNCKLVQGREIYYDAKFQGFKFLHLTTRGLRIVKNSLKHIAELSWPNGLWFSHLATRGRWIVKKLKKQRKIKITSSPLIIYLHNELQTCSSSWNLLRCKIPEILIFVFDHQGASNCQKLPKIHTAELSWPTGLWLNKKRLNLRHNALKKVK